MGCGRESNVTDAGARCCPAAALANRDRQFTHHGVMAAGRWLSPKDLDERLAAGR
jgi:hypothetical protein